MQFTQKLLKLAEFVRTRANLPLLVSNPKRRACLARPYRLYSLPIPLAENDVLFSKPIGPLSNDFFRKCLDLIHLTQIRFFCLNGALIYEAAR
jgi:hypothetical protein